MARIDKTDSAVGVVRAALNADVAEADYNQIIGVGLNAQGRIVKGAGNSGIVGVIIPDHTRRKAGMVTDIFVMGDAVEVDGLTAGTTYYLDTAGNLTAAADDGGAPAVPYTKIGFTVEADRLVIRL